MASKSSKIEHLKQVPLFAGCNRKELQHIAMAGDEITMTDGTMIVDQGQMGREAFVILDGSVEVRRGGRKITSLGTGDVVGELSLLDHGPRTASVVCVGDCSLFVLDQRHFRRVLEAQPSIALKLLGTLAGHIRALDRKYFG
jgi:CRP-like cAMP-binding protein